MGSRNIPEPPAAIKDKLHDSCLLYLVRTTNLPSVSMTGVNSLGVGERELARVSIAGNLSEPHLCEGGVVVGGRNSTPDR